MIITEALSLDHYTFTLRCKQKCAAKLGNLNGEIHKDLLPSHYHYLQFAYYKSTADFRGFG